jgi:hypothetical protein
MLLVFSLVVTPGMCPAATCEIFAKRINRWSGSGNKYSYMIERTRGKKHIYFIIDSDRWNLSDTELSQIVSRDINDNATGFSDQIAFAPLNADDVDYSPAKGEKPGMAGPARIRFDDLKSALCKNAVKSAPKPFEAISR